jgi:hypothetical protein
MSPVKPKPAHTDQEVAASRQLLCALLSRRDFVTAASVGALGLAGCGSGTPTASTPPPPPPPPPPSPPSGLSQVGGTIALPSGTGLSISTLTLRAMGVTTALSTAAFTIGVSPTAPTMALLSDASGNGIMAALLDPGLSGSQPITPRSTGIVLTWFALGGAFVPASVKSQLLALLTADPSMDALGAVVSQRISADPLAVGKGDAQVATALTTALSTLTAGTSASVIGGAHLAQPPTMTITPPAPQGGVNVHEDGSVVGVDIANSYRRLLKAYVYETQTITGGAPTNFSPARLVAGPIDIGMPATMSGVANVQTFLAQPVPFRSVTIPTIPLALDGASDQTSYDVVVIGPSANGVVPSFFSDPRYAAAVPGWNAAISAMFAQIFFCNLVYAQLLEMTGFGSVDPNSPNLAAATTTTQQFAGAPFTSTPAVPPSQAVFLSKYFDTMSSAVADMQQADGYHGVAPSIVDTVAAAALQQVSNTNWQALLTAAGRFVLTLTGPLAVLASIGNLVKLFDDVSRADRGLLWTVLLSKSTATITPANPAVAPGDQVALGVLLSPDLTSTYEYDWTQSSTTASFAATSDASSGLAIRTRQNPVSLVTTSNDTTPIAVQVAVYDVANGAHALVATTSAMVAILDTATLTPLAPGIEVGQQQTFTVAVIGSLPAGVQYLWTLTGNAGTIGALNLVTTTVPTLTYTGVRKGTDTLTVQVVDANNKLLAKASAQVTVDPDAIVDFIIAGGWDQTKMPPNGSYQFSDFLGGRAPAGITGNFAIDGIIFQFDNDPNGVGFLLGFFVPDGAEVQSGEVFTLVQPGAPMINAGEFTLLLDTNLVNPGDPNSRQYTVVGTGTFTIDTLTQLTDGTFLADFSLRIVNGSGSLVGSGTGTWK